jgi:hypothetical protein
MISRNIEGKERKKYVRGSDHNITIEIFIYDKVNITLTNKVFCFMMNMKTYIIQFNRIYQCLY